MIYSSENQKCGILLLCCVSACLSAPSFVSVLADPSSPIRTLRSRLKILPTRDYDTLPLRDPNMSGPEAQHAVDYKPSPGGTEDGSGLAGGFRVQGLGFRV